MYSTDTCRDAPGAAKDADEGLPDVPQAGKRQADGRQVESHADQEQAAAEEVYADKGQADEHQAVKGPAAPQVHVPQVHVQPRQQAGNGLQAPVLSMIRLCASRTDFDPVTANGI